MLPPLVEHGAAEAAAAAVAEEAGLIILPLSWLTGGAVGLIWAPTREMVSLLSPLNICLD